MIIGYARSTEEDQYIQTQRDALTAAGCIEIFEDFEGGIKREHPALNTLLQIVTSGDCVVVFELSRICTSTKHLMELAELFHAAEVDFISLQDNIDTTALKGTSFFNLMFSLRKFEHDVRSEKAKKMLSAGRARGRNGGRPKVEKEKIIKALEMYDSKTYSISEITNTIGISAPTLYRYLKNRPSENR